MNVFIASAALLTLLVTVWLIRPLLRKPKDTGISSERLNAAIHRDQLQALQADLARGVISQPDFEASRDELQLRLLDDTESFETSAPPSQRNGFWSARRTAALVGLSMPLLALGLYWQLGAPMAIDMASAGHGNEQQIQQLINEMADKLKANPDNPKGWAMLGRAYKAVNRLPEASKAFEKAGSAVVGDPDLLVDYAELLAMQAGNNLQGRPTQMVNEALRLNPEHPMALMLSGIALFQEEKFKDAIVKWEKLLTMMDPESPDAEQMRANIAEARSKAGLPTMESNQLPPVPAAAAAGMTPEKINDMVNRLAERLKANPDDLPGWARLARAYKVQGRLEEAEQAYARTGKLLDTDADLVAQYADLLATRANGNFKGKPAQLITTGLKLNPRHPMLLMMAGQAALQRQDFAAAIGHWETVLTVLPAGSPDSEQVKTEIASARAKMK